MKTQMKTQLVPNSFRDSLARDSLQTNPDTVRGNQMFTVLYDLMLYAVIPIAFQMSFVKIFQRSMNAYSANDTEAMSKLILYFIIQWFLGVLVRKQYLRSSLKKMTLAMLILIQIKESFIEEVFFDMLLSMIMESGLMVLLFFKFANLVVLLQMAGLSWLMLGTLLASVANRKFIQDHLNKSMLFFKRNLSNFMIRIHSGMMQYPWNRLYCC